MAMTQAAQLRGKAEACRRNITMDMETRQWTCDECFRERQVTGSDKPIKAYNYTCSSNVARHFMEFHKEMFERELVAINEERQEKRKLECSTKKDLPAKKKMKVKPETMPEEHIIMHEGEEVIAWEEDYGGSQNLDDSSMTEMIKVEKPLRISSVSSSRDRRSGSDDPLKIFFDAMYASVARMSRAHRLRIRRQMFDMVSEVEEMEEYPPVDEAVDQIVGE